MIEFKFVRWKNFVSYGDAQTEVRFDSNKATLVIGDNGAGKSTMIDALCYALYGKAFRAVATTQLVNSVNTNHMEVECEFRIGKQTYLVRRGLKPRFFEVWQNGKLLNQEANARDYQEVLEKQILKVTFKSFKQIVVLGSSNFVPFMQMATKDRKEVIEDLLDIGIFSIMSSILKDKVSENKDELQKLEYERSLIENRISLLHQHIESLRQAQSDDIARKKKSIKSASKEVDELESDVKKLSKTIGEFEERKCDEERVNKDIKEGEKILDKLLSKHDRHKHTIDFFHNKDECPTCQQQIEEEHKQWMISKEETAASNINSGIEDLRKHISEKEERWKQINEIQKEISDLQHQVIDKQSLINSKTMLIQDLEKQVTEVVDNDKLIKDEEDKITGEQIEMDRLYELHSGKVQEKNVMDVGTKLLRDTGIKSRIIKQYIPIINKLINKYLAAMDFFVQFELDENFNETIKSRYRDEFSYASFSEGEKMRIDLSLLFAWRAIAKLKNSANTNLLIMDEVFDSSLDTTGTDEFMKIVMDIVSDTNVFIITHKTEQLVDKFTNVIRFEKHKNFSRMVA